MFRRFLRSADYRGSDVRLDTGQLCRPGRWPRESISPVKWIWYDVLAIPYRMADHINKLELTMVVSTLKWRLRRPSALKTRFLHLVDSQVCLGVLTKGRSSSRKLLVTLRRANALTLLGQVYPLYGYIELSLIHI